LSEAIRKLNLLGGQSCNVRRNSGHVPTRSGIATKPKCSASASAPETMGIVEVVFSAASAVSTALAMMTAGSNATISAATLGVCKARHKLKIATRDVTSSSNPSRRKPMYPSAPAPPAFNSTVALPSYSRHDCCDGEDALCVPSPDLCMLSIPVAVGTRATPVLPHCRRRARLGRKRA